MMISEEDLWANENLPPLDLSELEMTVVGSRTMEMRLRKSRWLRRQEWVWFLVDDYDLERDGPRDTDGR